MSDIMAAIGIQQLKRFNKFSKIRMDMAKTYDFHLANLPIQKIIKNLNEVVPHIYPIILNSSNRREVQEALLAKGIESGYHYQPNHNLSFYRDDNAKSLVTTDNLAGKLLTLPMHADLNEDDVKYVCHELKKIICS